MKNANLVSWDRRWLWIAFATLFLAGCGQSEPAKPVVPKTVADYFSIEVGGQPVRMQLAVLRHEMERGLMDRRDLGPNDGMMFLYLRPQKLSYWMRNTPLPLDIGFFNAAGELKEIYAMHPFDETPVASHSEAMQFALEMRQGWFKANGIRPGDKVDLKALAAALRERDIDPTKFGLN